jgi:hypothetical protein
MCQSNAQVRHAVGLVPHCRGHVLARLCAQTPWQVYVCVCVCVCVCVLRSPHLVGLFCPYSRSLLTRLVCAGYLGASVSFHDETEVVLLCTNMFKKDFSDANPYVVCVWPFNMSLHASLNVSLMCLVPTCSKEDFSDANPYVVGLAKVRIYRSLLPLTRSLLTLLCRLGSRSTALPTSAPPT